MTNVEVKEIGKGGANDADVEAVIGKYQFTQADEG